MMTFGARLRVGVSLLFLAAGCAPEHAPTIPWRDSFPLALEAAAETRKALFIYFSADWCTICKQVEREAFSNALVAEAMVPFVAVKVDSEGQPWLAEKYQVEAVPAYLMLDSAGRRLGHALGYKSPDEMKQLLRVWSTGVTRP